MTLKSRMERVEWKVAENSCDSAQNRAADPRVQQAVNDPYTWATEYTRTHNSHWLEEGRPSPYEPIPKKCYLEVVFTILLLERIWWWEKSRDMMLTWACVAYLTLEAMKVAGREVLFQTQKEDKAAELVKYAKCLYQNQPGFLRQAFPLAKAIDQQPALSLEFRNGSRIIGIPGGANQIRPFRPWGYLNDESSFQPDAGECFHEALSAVRGKIIFNSSAAPGWYADARRDIIRNE